MYPGKSYMYIYLLWSRVLLISLVGPSILVTYMYMLHVFILNMVYSDPNAFSNGNLIINSPYTASVANCDYVHVHT